MYPVGTAASISRADMHNAIGRIIFGDNLRPDNSAIDADIMISD